MIKLWSITLRSVRSKKKPYYKKRGAEFVGIETTCKGPA